MNHPPIPKCAGFRTDYGPEFEAEPGWFSKISYLLEKDDYEVRYWRQIIAAVAEVEWRKRAARWEAISDLVYTRFWESRLNDETAIANFNARSRLITIASEECYSNARAWREWEKG